MFFLRDYNIWFVCFSSDWCFPFFLFFPLSSDIIVFSEKAKATAHDCSIFDQMLPEHIEYMLSRIPRGRFVQVEEIAAMVSWLVSEENSFTTGAVFDLSGGRATY